MTHWMPLAVGLLQALTTGKASGPLKYYRPLKRVSTTIINGPRRMALINYITEFDIRKPVTVLND